MCAGRLDFARQVSINWNQKPGWNIFNTVCLSLCVCEREIQTPGVREWPTFIFSLQVPSESCDPPLLPTDPSFPFLPSPTVTSPLSLSLSLSLSLFLSSFPFTSKWDEPESQWHRRNAGIKMIRGKGKQEGRQIFILPNEGKLQEGYAEKNKCTR